MRARLVAAAASVAILVATTAGVAAQSGDREELLARCEANATTPGDLALCRDVVERILAPDDGPGASAVPGASPRAAGDPLTTTGHGAQASEAFILASGDYAVVMETEGGDDVGFSCVTNASLNSVSGEFAMGRTVQAQATSDGPGTSSTFFYAIEEGRYYWETSFGCDTWTVTMQPVELDPGPPITGPVTREGQESLNTEPFQLGDGDYLVTWSIEPPVEASCSLYGTMAPTDGSFSMETVQAEADENAPAEGETRFFGVDDGAYYWSVSVINFSFEGEPCGWTLTIEPN
jgi:hypothetical protein